MTIANTCVVAAAFLPVITMGLAKFTPGGSSRYNNNEPRAWASKLDGWKGRAASAQHNGFEALPLFIFAVLAAQQAGLPQGHTDMLAMAFIALRVLYVAVYLMNIGVVRTLVWAAAVACAVGIVLPLLTFSA